MKSGYILGIAVALAITTGVSRTASAAYITFDDLGLPPLGDVTTQYAAQGVIFQGFTDAGRAVNLEVADNGVFGDNIPPSPPMSLSNFYEQDKYNRAYIMRLSFTAPANSISLMYNGAGSLGANTLFNVYSPSSVLLGTFTVPAAVDSNFYPLTVPASGVGYVDIVQPTSGWGHYIDNLSFQLVPEPTTAALVGVAVLALTISRRRQ